MDNLKYTHLLYVRKYSIFENDYKLFIYGVNTNDIYHTIGEYLTQSIEQVKRIDYNLCTQERIDFWKNNGYDILTFREKHKADTERHAHWVKNEPNAETMKAFHKLGFGKSMGTHSIYWTCSNCKSWGTPVYTYCATCGYRMNEVVK